MPFDVQTDVLRPFPFISESVDAYRLWLAEQALTNANAPEPWILGSVLQAAAGLPQLVPLFRREHHNIPDDEACAVDFILTREIKSITYSRYLP